ncbi:MAG TPA: VWA domain-containing protein [Caulobacteraceae bacterium]|nr:VWA domain-containing protein [Caulobacteraceae bacterium]
MPAATGLEDFLSALRANDVEISPAEAIDAHRAALAVGFADRRLLKDALCATLAKSVADERRFDLTFDRFFRRAPIGGHAAEGQVGPFDLEAALLADDGPGIAAAMESAATEAGVSDIRLGAQRSLLTRRLLDLMGMRALEARLEALRRGEAGEQALADRLAKSRRDLFEAASRYVGAQAEVFTPETGRRLREQILARQKLTAIAPEDRQAMLALVRRLARRLAKRYVRRRRRRKQGRLDVRATIRRSMGFQGTPFEVVWRRRTIERPKIVAICDVSRSVADAAAFLLLFLYCLREAVERFDAFAFSDRLVSVDDLLAEKSIDEAISLVLRRIGFRPTDYGRALADFFALHEARVDRRTTVIILGDGRSNFADPRLDLARRLSERARAVVWLNPEPEPYWGQGDSRMNDYRRFCHLARTCNSLAQLDSIIDRVLAAHMPS